MSEDEMIEGYRDGLDPDMPNAGPNRSPAYLHGFLNGRDDRRNQPRDTAASLRAMAEEILFPTATPEKPDE